MFIKTYFEHVFENIILKFWSFEEREALLKVLYEIYNSDHEFSSNEVDDFNKKLESLGVTVEQINQLPLDKAVDILQKDKLKHDHIYFVLAEAIFKDMDYDDIEKSYIQKIVEKYNLNESHLKEKIEEVRGEIIKDIMQRWEKEIDNWTFTDTQI